MPTYLVIHKPSNLVTGTVSTSYTPQTSEFYSFVLANEKALNAYYKWVQKNQDICPDIGEIISKSDYLKDCLQTGKAVAVRENLNQRYREPSPTPFEDREALISSFITSYPDADIYDLVDKFLCGTTVAKAYLSKYRQ